MDLCSRVGQVWRLDDSVEVILYGLPPRERLPEVRWVTLILWIENCPAYRPRGVGDRDLVGESAFANAEAHNEDYPCYAAWERIS